MQTLAYRQKDPGWDRLSRFFGRLFLINLAVGVVTGIVLEFQFGLNWSSYSVFVGNIFGAPLAIEGLLAFFLESTFIGLWIFGRDRLSARLHLATIWVVAAGTVLSVLFILAANAWMQHPVGYKVVHGQAVLTNFWLILGNSTLWAQFAHTVLAAFATGGAVDTGDQRLAGTPRPERPRVPACLPALGPPRTVFLLGAVVLTAIAGDSLGRVMDSQEPMKMAAAEGLYHSAKGAPPLAANDHQPVGPAGRADPGAARALAHRGPELERPGSGDRQHPGRRRGQVRARELRADDLAHLLVVPGDGRCRGADDPARSLGVAPRPAQEAAENLWFRRAGAAGSPCRSSPTRPAGS